MNYNSYKIIYGINGQFFNYKCLDLCLKYL